MNAAPVDQSSQVYLADLNSMSSWHRFGYAGHSLRPPEQFALTKSPTRSETPSMLTNPVNSLFVRNQLVEVHRSRDCSDTRCKRQDRRPPLHAGNGRVFDFIPNLGEYLKILWR